VTLKVWKWIVWLSKGFTEPIPSIRVSQIPRGFYFAHALADITENVKSGRMQNIYAHVRSQNIPRAT